MSDYQKAHSAFRNYRGNYQSERWNRLSDKYDEANATVNQKIGYKGKPSHDLSDHAHNLVQSRIKAKYSGKGGVVTSAGAGAVGAVAASHFTRDPKKIALAGGLTAGASGIAHVASRLRAKKKLAEAQRVHDAFKRETGQ